MSKYDPKSRWELFWIINVYIIKYIIYAIYFIMNYNDWPKTYKTPLKYRLYMFNM